jgi:hypothetical protein
MKEKRIGTARERRPVSKVVRIFLVIRAISPWRRRLSRGFGIV